MRASGGERSLAFLPRRFSHRAAAFALTKPPSSRSTGAAISRPFKEHLVHVLEDGRNAIVIPCP